MKTIEGIKIGNLEVEIKGSVERHNVYLGALRLSVDGREFILDVVQSYTHTPEETGTGTTRITCDIEVDEDTFDECPYDITKDDMLDCEHNDLVRELFVDGEEEFEVESITLYFEADGEDYQMKIDEE
jgi:hypothetical protein